LMFALLLVVVSIFTASAFNLAPVARFGTSNIQMSVEKISFSKAVGAAIIASSMISMPVFAKEGEGAKLGIFSNSPMSSPFPQGETREDEIYSPYSPYGDGTKATYNARKGGKEEVDFYRVKFDECVKRTERIPGYTAKKTWYETTTELTRYTYNMRSAMNRLADASKDPKAANAAAKVYFSDLNDVNEWTLKKSQTQVMKFYAQSVVDLNKFKALIE
jgi:hypothetical protein